MLEPPGILIQFTCMVNWSWCIHTYIQHWKSIMQLESGLTGYVLHLIKCKHFPSFLLPITSVVVDMTLLHLLFHCFPQNLQMLQKQPTWTIVPAGYGMLVHFGSYNSYKDLSVIHVTKTLQHLQCKTINFTMILITRWRGFLVLKAKLPVRYCIPQ